LPGENVAAFGVEKVVHEKDFARGEEGVASDGEGKGKNPRRDLGKNRRGGG